MAAQRNRKRPRGVKQITTALLSLVVLLYVVWLWLCTPLSHSHIPVRVTIPKGTGLLGIGRILQQDGIVRSGWAFAFYAACHAGGHALKPGRHMVSGDMRFDQILETLQHVDLRSDEIRVTIPEGFTLVQIADRLDESGIVDRNAFLAAARDRRVIAALTTDFPLPQDTLEGYLYPDTYWFKPHTPAAQVLQEMVLNFSQRFVRPYQQEVSGSGQTLHHIVTIASLIEREARIPADRERIAGVIANRLKRSMRLDVDATVLYALGHHKQRVLYKDLEVDSPYNTYRHKGLPPGPIANPGLDCLAAALHPESNNYLYYVARPDGAHIFSHTLAEHEAAKRLVRLERKEEENATEANPGG